LKQYDVINNFLTVKGFTCSFPLCCPKLSYVVSKTQEPISYGNGFELEAIGEDFKIKVPTENFGSFEIWLVASNQYGSFGASKKIKITVERVIIENSVIKKLIDQ
jgi:hypothetical protein